MHFKFWTKYSFKRVYIFLLGGGGGVHFLLFSILLNVHFWGLLLEYDPDSKLGSSAACQSTAFDTFASTF